MREYERQQNLLSLLRINPTLSLSELARKAGIARDTCRRDVEALEHAGLLYRQSFVVQPRAYLLVSTSNRAVDRERVRNVLEQHNDKCAFRYVAGSDVLCLATILVSIESQEYQTLMDQLLSIDGIVTTTYSIVGADLSRNSSAG